MPKVTIDGKSVRVARGATILDAARKAGTWVPTLCHHRVMEPPATCRLCMVELDGGDWKQLVTACNYPVRRDLVVSVSSGRAAGARRGVMQLLLARSPESQELRELAARMGVESTPYPNVTESQRNCMLCGLCTAVCEHVIGRAAIGFAGRGVDRAVATPFRQPSEDCIACGACAALCPVGTIRVRIHDDTGEAEISPFKTRVKLASCERCGGHIAPVSLAAKVFDTIEMDWNEFRERFRLCPKCRRRAAAGAMQLGSAGPR